MRVVVLGAGGMLGHKIYQILSKEFSETYAVFRKNLNHYAAVDFFNETYMRGGFDARLTSEVGAFLSKLKPDVVINCIGLTTRKLGAQTESDIILLNSVLPHVLKEWCLSHQSRLIHFSTDCVFSGNNGPYLDSSQKDAKDFYGQSKALGEVDGDGILTIRSSIVGLELEGKTELLEWFLSKRGQAVKGFSEVYYSGVTTLTMANVVLSLLKSKKKLGGVQQLASEGISKFELLRLANEAFQAGATVSADAKSKSNKVLKQSAFFSEHGIQIPSWQEQLAEVAKELKQYERWSAHVGQKIQSKAS